MRLKNLLIVSILMLITLTLTACEHSTRYEEDGLAYWEWEGEASVTGFVDEQSTVKDLVIKGKTDIHPEYYTWAIGSNAFENSDVETVTIEYYKATTNVFYPNDPRWPCTFDRILWQAFKNCKKLREVTFPKEMTTIDVEAFWGCESLEELTFPWGLRTINSKAFAYCSKLSVVRFDENLEFLGTNAFVNCSQQMTLYMKCPPPTVDGEIFSWGTEITIVVPQKLQESYTNHDYWGRFNIVVG